MRKTYSGRCLCLSVTFEADIDFNEGLRKCNCSFCLKTGYRKALIPFDALRIKQGKAQLREYVAKPSLWPRGDVNHYFCGNCGVHPFSRGYLKEQMGGNFWALNVSTLDLDDVTEEALGKAKIIYEDGKRDRQSDTPRISAFL